MASGVWAVPDVRTPSGESSPREDDFESFDFKRYAQRSIELQKRMAESQERTEARILEYLMKHGIGAGIKRSTRRSMDRDSVLRMSKVFADVFNTMASVVIPVVLFAFVSSMFRYLFGTSPEAGNLIGLLSIVLVLAVVLPLRKGIGIIYLGRATKFPFRYRQAALDAIDEDSLDFINRVLVNKHLTGEGVVDALIAAAQADIPLADGM